MSKKLLSIKVLSLIFAVLLMQVGFVRPVVAGTNAEKEAKFAEKVKRRNRQTRHRQRGTS